ncbi:membrane bound O-acyl transferase family-domain-containing protein [Luteolibacter flavescens]|uniref:Membrane bound O-acyl transferase family-domain-containing protein n=1 Tax=Luteolibacter flavescens TaxID=1859460 RepID=A0ABT3FV90_9BACT|nr:membrane bound O-acyl transferase family-domain-containing protein [Luteolibacter flavescens]MCW1887462.1 membrane bound O-acyl transferase family-domain-containing protein [Luteolibacter flavescens]
MIPILVATGIAAGPLLAEVRAAGPRRLAGWLLLLALMIGADRMLAGDAPLLRMIGICCVLLGAMKGLVYAEWADEKRQLAMPRYLIFSVCWFGMDPASFQTRRAGLEWKGDIAVGLSLMAVGTLGAWLVWWMGWRHILVMFLPMSLGFHFGALRVLKGVLRAAGFPVRTLFPNLLAARGIGDFWSKRWNVGYSQMMQRLVGRPVQQRCGESAGVMAVFLGSGLLHELAITLPVRAGFGLPTAFFAAHGCLTLLERKLGRPIGKIPALLAVALPLGVLFPPAFRDQVIARCLGVFDILAEWISRGVM